jgi:hypothetical protein
VKHFVLIQFLNLRQSVKLLGLGISPTQGRYLHMTTQTQNKCRQTIYVLNGIRTNDSGVRAGEGISCLRSHGHCDRRMLIRICILEISVKDTICFSPKFICQIFLLKFSLPHVIQDSSVYHVPPTIHTNVSICLIQVHQ